MIDSGSSRSNVYVYEWPGEKENETGVVTQMLNCRVSGESLSEILMAEVLMAKFWGKETQISSKSSRDIRVFHSHVYGLCHLSPGNGISEMKVDPEKDKESWKAFQECLDQAKKAIPAEKHKSTPLFLGATAGMRLLQ